MKESQAGHWPEYLMEAAGLGVFMLAAALFGTLLEHPGSPVRGPIPGPFPRRVLMGLLMGLTAAAIIYSPWGKRSGAHLNPSVTLTFFRLGKLQAKDALFYVVAQFAGGVLGVLAAAAALGGLVAAPDVRYVVTVPGRFGAWPAFAAEAVISFVLMLVVLLASNRRGLTRYTGLLAAALVATWISLEAPLSGMSMNPARTFSSALPAGVWTGVWIYFTAPPLGMLLAAALYLRTKGAQRVFCAKLHHDNGARCIFRCNFKALAAPAAPRSDS